MSLRAESSFLLLDGQNVLVKPNSDPVRLVDVRGVAITLALDSGVVGATSSFKLQASDFGINEQNPPTIWVDVASSSQTWAGTAISWNVTDIHSKWLRLVYTNAGASTAPTFTAWATLRRNQGIG